VETKTPTTWMPLR